MSDNSAAITDRAITKLVEGFDVYLRDIVTEFAVNAGVSAARVEAIGRGEQPTNREFEDLGFGYIDLLTFVAKEV